MGFLKLAGDLCSDIQSIWSPEKAMKSKMVRERYFGYSAAQETRKDERLPFDGTAEQFNTYSRDKLRARARDLERNNPITGSVLEAFLNNAIGTGFNMQAQTNNDVFNQRIEALWKEWEHHENCDITQQQCLDDIIKLIVVRKFVDGGIMATFPLDGKRKIPLTIQLHEVDDLDTMTDPKDQNGHIIVNGVELDTTGKPLGYWLKQTEPDGFSEMEPRRYDAKDVIVLWKKSRGSQFREITEMARTIGVTKDLGDYNVAVMFQQKIAACFSAFVETDNTLGAPGRIANQADGSRVENIEGGSIKYLKAGEHIKGLTPNAQVTDASNFLPLQQRIIAADKGLSLESTSRNVERVNYASARQNLLGDQLTYGSIREELVEYFLRPLYKRFVNICYLTGLLDGTGFKYGDEEYYKATWLAASLGWIDPLKEAQANAINLANGGKSFQEYCAEQGADWRDRIDQMKEVQDYAESKGVALAFGVQDSEIKNEPEDDDTGGKDGGNDDN